VMGAAVGDPPLFEKHNPVRAPQRGYPVRDQDDAAGTEGLFQTPQDLLFGRGIDRAERVIENENIGRGDQRARQRGPLLLPAESVMPRSPTTVSYPRGKSAISLFRAASSPISNRRSSVRFLSES